MYGLSAFLVDCFKEMLNLCWSIIGMGSKTAESADLDEMAYRDTFLSGLIFQSVGVRYSLKQEDCLWSKFK